MIVGILQERAKSVSVTSLFQDDSGEQMRKKNI